MHTRITKDGIHQFTGFDEIIATGLQLILDGVGSDKNNIGTASLRVVLVDKNGTPLVQICKVELSVGDTATLLNLEQPFNVTINSV